MSLLAGLGLICVLGLFTFVVLYFFEHSKEFPIALVGVMLFGDILATMCWYNVGIEFISDVSKFKFGISLSFMIISFMRALIFFIHGKKKGYL